MPEPTTESPEPVDPGVADAPVDPGVADAHNPSGADGPGQSGQSGQPRQPGLQDAAAKPWRQTLLRWLRPSRAQLVWALALAVVVAAIVVQVRSTQASDRYAGMRRDDLVQLLDGLTQETDQLSGEVAELERTRDSLQSGVDAGEVAREQAQKRADTLAILAGTVPASGPGVRITISADAGSISASLLLDTIHELRDAGAEVIEINDAVRLVAQSWTGQNEQNILIVDNQQIDLPIVIDAIGDAHALAESARFRGGLVSQVESDRVNGSVTIEELDTVEITSLAQVHDPQYAEPA
ncbi:DUF881 domain-containing protein [Propionimicrobium sp. PCR01-08-3]|uniref:DUF881 domain-containing protein n=1 Tax=Propionimicrobium sp. PCR01-08-3 TaxID=3052086 RepID=UPI00255CC868|nr:DUF881 domain-containing protein [Propionimicrobium sp. PCR01-08-3]WIY84072.1 DUF881 domain-containing protein [Propionimicrobium sp. PCR01-08-3]